MFIHRTIHGKINHIFMVAALLFFLIFLSCFPALPSWNDQLSDIKMPEGFTIEVFTDQVPGARSMALSPNGTLL